MKTNPNDPAFPSHGTMGEVCYEGMTKREIFAAMAMNGLCHDYGRNSCVETGTHENIAMISVKLADALIQKLNEGVDKKEGE